MQSEVRTITYTPEQLATLLGISRTLVYRLLDRGEIASIRISNRRLVLQAEVDAYLTRKQTEATIKPDGAA